MSVGEFLQELKAVPAVIRDIDKIILDYEENITYNIEYYSKKIAILEEKYNSFMKLKQMPRINLIVYEKIESELILMIHYMQEVLGFLEKASFYKKRGELNLYNECMNYCVQYMNSSIPLFVNSYLNDFNINDIISSYKIK